MANVTVVAANVIKGANSVTKVGIAAVAITAGQTLSLDSSRNLALYDADSAAISNILEGIALANAAAGQPIDYTIDDDDLTIGTLVAGTTYIGSATAGAIGVDADATPASGIRKTIVGVAKSTTKLFFRKFDSAVVL